MADDEQSSSGELPALVQAFVGQLRAITEGLEDLAGLGQRLPSASGLLPLPGTLSAAQLTSIADSIAAQRRSIEALKAQLSAFDGQLAALEQILGRLPSGAVRGQNLKGGCWNSLHTAPVIQSLRAGPVALHGIVHYLAAGRASRLETGLWFL